MVREFRNIDKNAKTNFRISDKNVQLNFRNITLFPNFALRQIFGLYGRHTADL